MKFKKWQRLDPAMRSYLIFNLLSPKKVNKDDNLFEFFFGMFCGTAAFAILITILGIYADVPLYCPVVL